MGRGNEPVRLDRHGFCEECPKQLVAAFKQKEMKCPGCHDVSSKDFKWYTDGSIFRLLSLEYSVDLVKLYLSVEEHTVKLADIVNIAGMLGFIAIEDTGEKVDFTVPIIIAELNRGKELVQTPIDGWHRIRQAKKDGIKYLPVVKVNYSEAVEEVVERAGLWDRNHKEMLTVLGRAEAA